MMMMEMMSENPTFCLESDTPQKAGVNETVTVKAIVKKKSEIGEKDGEICYVTEYEVQSVDGKDASEKEEPEDMNEGDDMEEIGKVIDEEMSKSKGSKETEDEE